MENTQKWVTILSKCRKDHAYRNKVNSTIDGIIDLINSGRDESMIKKEMKLSKSSADILIEIAKARVKVSGKFSRADRLWLDLYSASYSTPEVVGKYRASRISGKRIIDVGSGAGLQSIMFAEDFNVTGIEMRRERVEMSYLNAEVYGVRKIRFINADYVSVIDNLDITGDDVIFSDPLRPRTEERRTLDSIVPSPLALMKLASRYTGNFVFDLPPQMRWEEITIEGEKEYTSLNGRLNRLTLYTGSLAGSGTRAVMLPEGTRISGKPDSYIVPAADRPEKYLYVPDPSVLYARLVHSVPGIEQLKLLTEDKRRLVLTSSAPPGKDFPGEVFEVLLEADEEKFLDDVAGVDSGEAFLKFQIEPEEYYDFKKKIDDRLSGSGAIYIFRHEEKYIAGKRVVFS